MLVLNKSWPWHVEVIPGVNVVEMVTNEELCSVVWGIIKNFMNKYSFVVVSSIFKEMFLFYVERFKLPFINVFDKT